MLFLDAQDMATSLALKNATSYVQLSAEFENVMDQIKVLLDLSESSEEEQDETFAEPCARFAKDIPIERRRQILLELLELGEGNISAQILRREFSVNAMRGLTLKMTPLKSTVQMYVDQMRRLMMISL